MNWSRLPIIILGVFLIAVITPLSQFLTILAVNAEVESGSPIGWAVGLIFSLVLVLAILKLLLKFELLSKPNIVILYCMLTLSIPIMNIGFVRSFFMSMTATIQEYLLMGTSTYRTAYNSLKPDWFPVIPTMEGLAWSKADRLLRLIQDDKSSKIKSDSQRKLAALLNQEMKKSGASPTNSGSATGDPSDEMLGLIRQLGAEEITSIRSSFPKDFMVQLALDQPLQDQYNSGTTSSQEAARNLPSMLGLIDELAVSQIPEKLESLDPKSRERIHNEVHRLTDEQKARLAADIQKATEQLPAWNRQMALLTATDLSKVRSSLKTAYQQEFSKLPAESLAQIRQSFVYRLSRSEREQLIKLNGDADSPNENYYGFKKSVWNDLSSSQQKLQNTTWENLQIVWDRLPWHIWLTPILLWGTLFTCLYLLIMCMAEWLRRKWVDRENLAFPLVEIVDSFIRHDSKLEGADDVKSPPKREWYFSPLFAFGILAGIFILSLEALGHYSLTSKPYVLFLNVSEKMFTTGALKEASNVFFVISPIVVGILFLVSLEVSFSIWVIFMLYKLTFTVLKISVPEFKDMKDQIFTGYANDKTYPFEYDQMLGASICFALIILFKMWRSRTKGAGEKSSSDNYFIHPTLYRTGMILLPIVIVCLLWNMGITNLPLILGFGFLVGAFTLATTRVRAETGLHTQHTSYSFFKLPMVFGMTDFTGAKVFSVFINIAFLPATLFFRSLPQFLENIELARRHNIRYRTIAASGFIAFAATLIVGVTSFLLYSYYFGEKFHGMSALPPLNHPASAPSLAAYPLWGSHFLGENGLDKFNQVVGNRVGFMFAGFAIFGALSFLRNRFMKFPVHPIGYLLILLSVSMEWMTPFVKSDGKGVADGSLIWGSALAAWLVKKLIIKYGGMNTYKEAKPFFIGLVVGSVVCIFGWNMIDLVCSIIGENSANPSAFIKLFMDKSPFTPRVY